VARLERWVAGKAELHHGAGGACAVLRGYGWVARGGETSDTVSDSGWKLFRARHAKAKAILDQAAKLRNKCPEWYVIMQQVALAQEWKPEQAAELLQQAHRIRTRILLLTIACKPTISCQSGMDRKGETEQFAAESADRVGGDAGDILYFQIASETGLHLRRSAVSPHVLAASPKGDMRPWRNSPVSLS